jgi:HK97 family phage major capsid protein
MTVLDDLRARVADGATYINERLSAAEERAESPEDAALTEDETRDVEYVDTESRKFEERIALLERQEARAKIGGKAALDTLARVVDEPLTYNRYAQTEGISYIRDSVAIVTGRDNKFGSLADARERMQRHGQEMDRVLPERAKKRDAVAKAEARAQGWDNPFEKRVNPNRTDGQGGYLVPPVWLMDDLIPILRAGRVAANLCKRMDLPTGTDSINIPKLSTGTTAAIQTADNASVSSTDFTDTSVSANVKTIAGQQDVAIQLVEQSPLPLDEILYTDLIADYNKKLDLQVLAGSNASGQVEGLYSSAGGSPWSNTATITYTSGSPTVAGMWPVFAQSLSNIAENRFTVDNVAFIMHPRRWFWFVGALDSQNRPLVVINGSANFNTMATANGAVAEGYVGNLAVGAPAYVDANVTTTDTAGSGSAQDIIFALKTDDAFLFEGDIRQRELPEVLSGTLQVRFQVYNYLAFLLRYGQSLAISSGTGFAAPSGY